MSGDGHDVATALGLAWAPDLPALPTLPLLAALPMQYARRHLVLPLGPATGPLTVAVADPLATAPLDDLRFLYERPVEPLVVPATVLQAAIARAYDTAAREPAAAAALRAELDRPLELGEGGLEAFAERPDLLDADDEAPVIRLVNALLTDAAKARASDVHLEPYERALVVRFRIDGVLHDVLAPPPRLAAAIASRVKIIAGLDVAERRLPQDGRLGVRIGGHDLDVRVSIVPTAFGERVALRLLHRSDAARALEALGMTTALVDRVAALLGRTHGILLVTGPTGSGKTTTLYAALRRVADGTRNVMTIEDPIEYQLPGIAQMQVHPRIGLTFAAGLRAILRQDPDVILVGEIRDRETVEIALQAALTGHLVLATLHTNDAASTMTRLLDMGVEPYLIASSVVAVLAQRLVRRTCTACGGAGCPPCRRTGFHGRIGIHELVVVDDGLRAGIMGRADASTLRREAYAAGTIPLRDDGLAKARAGITTEAEVIRVTQESDS
jgi:general secretion pathway protein E